MSLISLANPDGNASGARNLGASGRRRVGNPPQVDNLPHEAPGFRVF
jgi:hypothetical protein